MRAELAGERALAAAVAAGQPCIFLRHRENESNTDGAGDNPSEIEATEVLPVEDRQIRGAYLAATITGKAQDAHGTPIGVDTLLPKISYAVITGTLDLEHCGLPEAPLPDIFLFRCDLEEVWLTRAYLRGLDLRNCTLGSLAGEGVRADWIDLRRLQADWINLANAKVDGNVMLSGAALSGVGEAPLSLANAHIGGDLELASASGKAFHAAGCIFLGLARIGGNLMLESACFGAGGDFALQGDGLTVTGDAVLAAGDTERLRANGCISFASARFGGDLLLDGALIQSRGFALQLRHAEIDGSLMIGRRADRRFEAQGQLLCAGMRVHGRLFLDDAQLVNPGAAALLAEGAAIAGGVRITGANGFVSGLVSFHGATIGVDLAIEGGRFESGLDGDCLLFGDAELPTTKVGVTVDYALPPTFAGGLRFDRARFRGDLVLRRFSVDEEWAGKRVISLRDAEVSGALRVRLDSEAAPGGEIDLRGLHVRTLDDVDKDGRDGWGPPPETRDGRSVGHVLRLNGFRYDRIEAAARTEAAPVSFLERLQGVTPAGHARLLWLDRSYRGGAPASADFEPQPYEHLARLFRQEGHPADANLIGQAKLAMRRRCRVDGPLSRAISALFGLGFGYGYSGLLAAATVVLWLGVGSALFYVAHARGVLVDDLQKVEIVRPPQAPAAPAPAATAPETRCSEAPPWAYALDVMLPVVDLHYENKCQIAGDAPGYWHAARAVYAVIGWIIVALATLTFSGVLRRD